MSAEGSSGRFKGLNLKTLSRFYCGWVVVIRGSGSKSIRTSRQDRRKLERDNSITGNCSYDH